MEKVEVVNYLLAHENFKIIQRKDMFNFSLDTVLLADFCSLNKDIQTVVDFGTNNAAIPLLISMRTKAKIEAIEIQEEACEIARKNVEMNHLEDQITIIHDDIKHYATTNKQVDVVLCNPPFFRIGERSNTNENEMLKIARHEIMINLEEIIQSASKVLKQKGRLAMVHRPDRLIEVIMLMKKYDIEPKRLRMIYPKQNRECNTILIEGVFKGKSGGLKILPPLYAHEEDGSYSQEVRRIFGEKIDE